jgi:DNA-directed RNA polymerase specialized sigma24 family protein
MACAVKMLVWWDRDFDSVGRPIRADVRSAGHDLWRRACQETVAVLADQGAAAELMEDSVARVSRYLDRIGAPLTSRKHGLVMVAFSRALRRYRTKLGRLEPRGDSSDFSDLVIETSWLSQSDARLDLEKIIRQLSSRSAEVLMLRAAGYEWNEIARIFQTTAAAVRNGFWREIGRVRSNLWRG